MFKEKILVIEDDIQIQNFMVYTLENAGFSVEGVAKGKDGIDFLIQKNADLVLLDLGLPDMDGMDVLHKIRKWSEVPIIIVSARDQDKEKAQALDDGADDYLTKPFSATELMARIRGTYRRIQYMKNNMLEEEPVFQNGSLTIDYKIQTAYVNREEVHLPPIEYKILCLLAKNMGRVLTHTHITKEIWGSSLEGDIASLRVHVATLRKKIEKKDRNNKCIQTHIGIGYCMVKQE